MSIIPRSNNSLINTDIPDILQLNPYTTKYTIHLKAIGATPQLKQYKYKLSGAVQYSYIEKFIVSQVIQYNYDHMYCYINSTFIPDPTQLIGDLYLCYSVNNELIINYCTYDVFG